MSVRYEWMGASYTGVRLVTGGGLVGDHEVDNGKYAVVLSGDECTVIEGTKDELREFALRVLERVDGAGPPTQRTEKRVRDVRPGDLFMYPDDEGYRELIANPLLVDGNLVLITGDGNSQPGTANEYDEGDHDPDAVVFVLEQVD